MHRLWHLTLTSASLASGSNRLALCEGSQDTDEDGHCSRLRPFVGARNGMARFPAMSASEAAKQTLSVQNGRSADGPTVAESGRAAFG